MISNHKSSLAQASIRNTENEQLSYCNKIGEARKTPLTEEGKFVNEEFPFGPTFEDFKRWRREPNPYAEEKKTSSWALATIEDTSWKNNNHDFIMWLGHASFLLRINGLYLITDPVFGNATPLHKRKSAFPMDLSLLPPVDYILLSHNHRDHFNKKSLRTLKKKNPSIQILSGLRMDALLKGIFQKDHIQCAGWYQQYQVKPLEITFLPARHWAKRGLFDNNDHLWGAFVIQYNQTSIYFSGDTGEGRHLKEAGDWFQPNYVIMGIGAYQPEWFMQSNHISPKNAIKAFQSMKGSWMIPMHYGCFDLSDESMEDPLRVYLQEKQVQPNPNAFLSPIPGEIIWLTH